MPSLPPELTPAQREDAKDPYAHLGQLANIAELESLGRGEWITLYEYQDREDGGRCSYSGLLSPSQVNDALKQNNWDLSIGDGRPSFTQATINRISTTTYNRSSNEWAERLAAKVRHVLRLKTAAVAEPGCDIGIVVALKSPELDAVLQLPWGWTMNEKEGDTTVYHGGEFKRKDGTIGTAVVARAGQMGMPAATAMATKLGLLFRPKCLAMVGICAGNKDETVIGDLVVANPTWDYGSGKYSTREGVQVFEPAPYPLTISTRIRNIVERHEGESDLLNRLRMAYPGKPPSSVPALRIGPFATGAAVVARSAIVQEVKTQQHRKLMAIDMEAYGVAMAAQELLQPQPDFIVMKGVSDYADEDKGDSHRDYAAFMSAQYLGLLCTDYALC